MGTYLMSAFIYSCAGWLSLAIYTAMEEKAEDRARYKHKREAMLKHCVELRNGGLYEQ